MLELRLHTLDGCDLPADLGQGDLELSALGDFTASNASAEAIPLSRGATALEFPITTRAVAAKVSVAAQRFAGYAERKDDRGLDLLLWPELRSCPIFRPDGALGYPGRAGGQALAYVEELGLVVAAGGNDALVSDAIVGALSFDTERGRVTTLDTSEPGVLRRPRAFASSTRFGERLLFAGGETPVFGVPDVDIEPLASAEVFDPVGGGFTGELIELNSSRTHHAALTLPDGRTLLLGGRSKSGNTSIAQYQLETLDPNTSRASIAGTITGRIDPRALALSDGRIFVGGGVDIDGKPVEPAGEWLSARLEPDETPLPAAIAARFDRAFAALPGGGVLAVGGCEDRAPVDEREADVCSGACRHGCPPSGGYDAFWIDARGVATPVALDEIAAPRPILLPGSDGSPWLVAASDSVPSVAKLFRFNAWTRSFSPVSLPSETVLPRPGFPQPLGLGADLFVWIDDADERGRLLGLELGTRSRFAEDRALVLSSDPLDPSRPLHLAPDRAPPADAYDGTLRLSGDLDVQVTDTDYADVTVKLYPEGTALPLVALGQSVLGDDSCPWPRGPGAGGPLDVPTLVRQGDLAELRFHGQKTRCAVSFGRLRLSFRAGRDPVRLRQIDVLRGVPTP